MPDILPLYPEVPVLAVEDTPPLETDHDCERCTLHKIGRTTRCMSPEGEPGGLLVVSDYPGRSEDASGRPMYGKAGRYLRSLIQKLWNGPVAFDNALRCAPFGKKPTVTHLNKCRPYMAQTFAEVQPERVIAAGTQAIRSIIGSAVPPLSVRGGYTWLGKSMTPVFLLVNPAAAIRNRFVRDWFEEDLKKALTADVGELRRKAEWLDSWYQVVRTEDDAKEALAAAKEADFIAYDLEWAGRPWEDGTRPYSDTDDFCEPAFRPLCFSFCGPDDHLVWSWDEAALHSPVLLGYLKQILESEEIAKIGQNEKSDRHTAATLGINVRNYILDTRLVRRIMDPEVTASLEVMQYLVGMGGGKDEMTEARAKAVRRVRKSGAVEGPADLIAAVRRDHCNHGRYSYGLVDKELLLRYNAADTLSTARLGARFRRELDEGPKALRAVWHDLVLPQSLAVTQIERWGIAVDRDTVDAFQSLLMLKQQECGSRVQLLARNLGFTDFNAGSPLQMRALLFEKLKLKPGRLTKTGLPSTDRPVLDTMVKKHEIIKDIVTLREVVKLRGTYADPLPGFIRADGRVHPSVKLDGARSGRPSCIARGTLVETLRDVSRFPKGVPIEQVEAGDLVYTYTDDGRLTIRRVRKAWCKGVRPVVRICWRGAGRRHAGYLDLTEDHEVRLASGLWLFAGDLVPGDSVTALSRGRKSGYARLWPTGAPEVRREHRFIFDELYGWLPEHVHHKNENTLDNRPENLEGMSAHDHLSHHGRDCPVELREFRRRKMLAQIAEGKMADRPRGEAVWNWLELSRQETEDALRENNWSVCKAARALGHDFACFKRHVVRVGFAVDELKALNWQSRRERGVAGRKPGNHEVLTVEPAGETEVWDLEVEDTHNFIAGELCVHNCEDPNLYNVPRAKSEESKMARDCYVAPPGHKLVQFDYSQLELRVAAIESGDPLMREIFVSGDDYHYRTAQLVSQQMWGLAPEDVPKKGEERSTAKTINFGVLYGMGPPALAARLGCSIPEAEKVNDLIMGKFSKLKAYTKAQVRFAQREGVVWTTWNGSNFRRRPLYRVADSDSESRSRAENGTWNTPIQGKASDYCAFSMVECVDWLIKDAVPAKLVLSVYDSLIFEVRDDALNEVIDVVPEIMTQWDSGDPPVPIVVDTEVGQTWGSLEKV